LISYRFGDYISDVRSRTDLSINPREVSMAVSSVSYLGFNATDLGEWRTFATDVLGLQETTKLPDAGDDTLFLRMDDRSYRFSIHKEDEPGLRHFGLECLNAVELAATVADLEAAGVAVTTLDDKAAAARGVRGLVTCKDPAGNVVEISHTAVFDHDPFASPQGVSGFVTGEMGLGHLVLLAAPYKETLEFYTDLLGFKKSDMMVVGGDVQIDFLHCNPRHHSLALGDAHGINGVAHFMIEVETVDDVGYALDRFRDNNVPLSMGLGRHGNDFMLSFYGKTPSGFDVEFGTGGRYVDDANWRTTEIPITSMWGHRPEAPGVDPLADLQG